MGIKTNITKIFTFDSAHKLYNYDGKCANLHGHTYILEVTVSNKLDPSEPSMIIDFNILKKIIQQEVIERFDHKYLKEIVEYNPTVEDLARDIFNILEKRFLKEFRLILIEKIKLYETPDSFAEVIRW